MDEDMGFVAACTLIVVVLIITIVVISRSVDKDRMMRKHQYERKLAACESFEDPDQRLVCLAVLR